MKIAGLFICAMMIAVVVFPATGSINDTIDRNFDSFINSSIKLNNENLFTVNNNNDDSNNVLIELDIKGKSYGQELLWVANTTGGDYEESAVVYSDGIAYIGSCSNHGGGHDRLFAVDATDGTIIWSIFMGPTYVGPVIDDDRIYIAKTSHGYDGINDQVLCINRLDGKIIWSRNFYWGNPESIQYDNEKIYFASYSIFALDKDNGTIIWEYVLDDVSVTKPILKDNAFFTATSAGTMLKVDVKDGKKIWEVAIPGKSWDNSITADGQGHIFLSIYTDKSINAYDEFTGELLWSYKLHDKSFSFNAYHNNVIFISDLSGYVYAINSSTGNLIWEKKIGNICDISSPTLSGGLLFIGTRDFCEGKFFALNETNGDIVWKYHVGASITAPPSIVDGMMLCGTDGWNMYAFDFGIGDGDWPLHRYDQYNTAFSPDGLLEWQFVSAICSTMNNITTCDIKNTYDHIVNDVRLELPNGVFANWYDDMGNLLKSESGYLMIDELSAQSTLKIIISEYQEYRPNKPTISGPKFVIPGTEYTYMFSTDDSNNDELSYLIYWDDGSYNCWTPFQSTEQTLMATHTWFENKTFSIKAKVKNSQGIESEWSDPFKIILSHSFFPSRHLSNIFLNQFADQIKGHKFFCTSSFPIPFSITWMKHYGGENEERGQSVQQTDDGGYIITGYTYSYGAGSFDVWLLKTDQYGNKIWDRTFGGKSADFGNSVQQTTDGGFIITGSLSWNRYLYLIKTDRNGNLIWEKAFEGYAEAEGKSVQQTADGGYIITGYTNSFDGDNSDLWLIKTDGDGNKIWDRMFGGASFEYGTSVLQTSDGEYVVTGFTKSYGAGNNDIWLIKTDSDGNEIWDKTFGGADEDRCYCFQQTNDDGFILAGITYSSVSPDVWLIKTDASGNKLWDIIFGGNCADFGFSVQQTADGGYIIVGLTESFGEYFCDVWLIKTDSDGNKIWDRTFHGLSMEYGESVQQTADGGFILTGGTFSYGNGYDLWLIKTDDQGRSKTKIKNHFSFQGLFTSKLARFFIVI